MKTLLGIPLNKIDRLKYMMQLRVVMMWLHKGARGTIELATGVGKSIVACLAMKKIVKSKGKGTFIVVVPTRQLKSQWESILTAFNLIDYTEVLVINTIALKENKYVVDLLVIDEIHMMAADKFSTIFTKVKYKWLMGLTATIDRMDGKELLIKKYAPVVYKVTQKQAIENGWINDFVEINCPVYLNRNEVEQLESISKQIRYYTGKFGDFTAMRNCINLGNATNFALNYYPKESLNEKAKEIQRDAAQGQRYISKRQEILYKNKEKVTATVDIIDEFKLKTITFSQSTEFADEVKYSLGAKAVAYHSNLESKNRKVEKTKTYKTLKSASKFASGIGGKIRERNDSYEVYWKEVKRIGVTTLKKEALSHFSSNRYKERVICTARALDQGFDVPDVQLGVDGSRTSNPTQHTQRTGRVARNHTYKDGTEKQSVYINLFIPNSKDEYWLKACQKNSTNVITVDNLKECKDLIRKILKIT